MGWVGQCSMSLYTTQCTCIRNANLFTSVDFSQRIINTYTQPVNNHTCFMINTISNMMLITLFQHFNRNHNHRHHFPSPHHQCNDEITSYTIINLYLFHNIKYWFLYVYSPLRECYRENETRRVCFQTESSRFIQFFWIYSSFSRLQTGKWRILFVMHQL